MSPWINRGRLETLESYARVIEVLSAKPELRDKFFEDFNKLKESVR